MDRESKVVSLSSNEVQMVLILTSLVGDKVAIRKNCLCFRAAVSELHTRHTRNKQRRHPPAPPLTPQPTKHNIVFIVAKETNHLTARTTIFHPTFVSADEVDVTMMIPKVSLRFSFGWMYVAVLKWRFFPRW
jgi:hypothetical protein